MLSEADVRQYHHDGLLIPQYRLSKDRLGEIREAYAKFVADNPQVHRDQVVNPCGYNDMFARLKFSVRVLVFQI